MATVVKRRLSGERSRFVQLAPGTAPVTPDCGVSLQSKIDAAPAGSTLDLSGCTYTANATINKALTLVGATLNYSGTGAGISVTASNVTIQGCTLTGQGYSTFYINNAAVRIVGVKAARLTGIVVTGCTITGWSYGVDAFYTTGQDITTNTITNVAYAGVMVHSALNGYIRDNSITGVGVIDAYGTANPSARYNAYGIACTRNSSSDDRSTGVVVEDNTVDNVPNWHGLDTHGGDAIEWLTNTVTRCNRGLFITGDGFGGVSTDNIVNGNSFANPTRYPGTGYGYNQRAMTLISGTTGTTGSGNLVDGHPYGEDISGNTGTNSITGTTVTNPY